MANNRRSNKSDYGDNYNYNKNSGYQDISSKSRPTKRRKGKIIANVLIVILCVLLAVSGSAMIYFYDALDSMNFKNIDDESTSSSDPSLLNDSMVLNILLFGSDSLTDTAEDGRSDSIMMVSLDNRNKTTKLTSFLRDTWVDVPGYGSSKLNAAYAYGGPKLAVETIEKNFGVDVDRYMVVDFRSFLTIIDILGGIDVELTADEAEMVNYIIDVEDIGTAPEIHGAGVHHLDGLQALAHARNRNSILSDFDRTSRQRQVINCIVAELKNASLPQITSIVSEIGPMITTNLKKSEITALLANSLTYLNYPVVQKSAPDREDCIDKNMQGQAVLVVPDWITLKKDLAEFLYGTTSTTSSYTSTTSTKNKTSKY